MPPTLFVGNVPQSAQVADLEVLFKRFGRIINCTIRPDAKGRPFGYGFVEMDDDKDAQDAIAALDGYEISGTKLRVDKSRASERDQTRTATAAPGERRDAPRPANPDGFSVIIENLPDHASWQVRCGS